MVSASLIKPESPKDKDKYIQLPERKVSGSTLYPQKNLKTGKIEYFRVPPSPKGGAGSKTALTNEQKIITTELNEIRKAHNIGGSIDIFSTANVKR